MKKRLIQFALILALAALSCAAAYATDVEEPTTGFRAVSVESAYDSDVTLEALDENGAKVDLASDGVRYPGAVKMKISYGKAQANSEYLLCVLVDDGSANLAPDVDNMAYIDQVTAQSGSVEFTAFPKSQGQANSVKYAVYLSSNADASEGADVGVSAITKIAAFEYYSTEQAYTLGDVDDNGAINAIDARITLQIAAKLVEPTEQQRLAANVNKDGAVNAIDARLILQRAAKLIDSFPD